MNTCIILFTLVLFSLQYSKAVVRTEAHYFTSLLSTQKPYFFKVLQRYPVTNQVSLFYLFFINCHSSKTSYETVAFKKIIHIEPTFPLKRIIT